MVVVSEHSKNVLKAPSKKTLCRNNQNAFDQSSLSVKAFFGNRTLDIDQDLEHQAQAFLLHCYALELASQIFNIKANSPKPTQYMRVCFVHLFVDFSPRTVKLARKTRKEREPLLPAVEMLLGICSKTEQMV